MYLPKVLIINQPFNNHTGGGITLSNLFSGWERDKLAVACSGYLLSDNIDTHVCNTYYQLGFEERKWIFPLNYFKRKYYSGLIKFDSKRIQNLTIKKSRLRERIIKDYIYPFLEYFGLFNYISKTILSSNLCNWLNDFNPDVIYAQASSREEVLFCLALHSYLKKPLIFHMMDDWPSTIGKKGILKNFWRKKIDHEFRILLHHANVLMSISDYMAYEYKIRYGKDFITFHNPININFWKKYQKTTYKLSDSPIILYAGRIGLGIETSLISIAKAIEKINQDLEISIKLVLQTQQKPLWINDYKNVVHSTFVPYDELPKVFSECDFLILPYDFNQSALNFIKYSMPTKAPEYMASGTPIIVFAPEITAIVEYAKKYKWAKVISKNDINHLTTSIKDLIQNKTERQKFSQNAIQIAEKNHNSIDVTNHFKAIVCSLVTTATKINLL